MNLTGMPSSLLTEMMTPPLAVPVEFGQDDAGDIGGMGEFLCLIYGVLPGDCVEYKAGFHANSPGNPGQARGLSWQARP